MVIKIAKQINRTLKCCILPLLILQMNLYSGCTLKPNQSRFFFCLGQFATAKSFKYFAKLSLYKNQLKSLESSVVFGVNLA